MVHQVVDRNDAVHLPPRRGATESGVATGRPSLGGSLLLLCAARFMGLWMVSICPMDNFRVLQWFAFWSYNSIGEKGSLLCFTIFPISSCGTCIVLVANNRFRAQNLREMLERAPGRIF